MFLPGREPVPGPQCLEASLRVCDSLPLSKCLLFQFKVSSKPFSRPREPPWLFWNWLPEMFGRHDDLSANMEIRTSTFPTRKFSLSEKQTNKKTKNSDQWNHPVNKWDQWRSDLEGRCYQPFPYTLKSAWEWPIKAMPLPRLSCGDLDPTLDLWGTIPSCAGINTSGALCPRERGSGWFAESDHPAFPNSGFKS